MSKELPPNPSLEYLKKQSKHLLRAYRRGDRSVCAILRSHYRFRGASDDVIMSSGISLLDVQHAVGLEYGFRSWQELSAFVKTKEKTMDTKAQDRKTFAKASDLAKTDNKSIQAIMNEIDTEDLASALVGTPKEWHRHIYNNLSRGATETIKGAVKSKGAVNASVVTRAEEMLLDIANRLEGEGRITVSTGEKGRKGATQSRKLRETLNSELSTKSPAQRDTKELVSLLKVAAELARQDGLVSLDKVVNEAIDDEYLKMGLQMVIDGYAPDYVRDALATKRESMVKAYERRLDMLTTAISSISRGDQPAALEKKCQAFLS